VESFAAAVEASAVAAHLKQARWTYPAVNTLHIFGIALLFGAVAPMDLRLVGLWRGDVPLRTVLRLLRPVAAVGAALAVLSGLLLFSVKATDYIALQLFFVKMALVAIGLAHALANGALVNASPRQQRAAGAISLAVWAAVLVCGRMLGYL
jgi:hypothetical protein